MEKTISIIVLVGGNYDKELYKKCRKTFSWADEVVEIDTKKVRGSFADWRSEGLKRAKGNWILYVDTDEEITSALRAEVTRLISKSVNQYSAYAIPRKNIIFGKEFKHGGQYPDYQKRLFLRTSLKKWEGKLHEEPRCGGKLGKLENAIIHHKNMTLSQMLEKTNKWSEIEADLLYKSGHSKMNGFRFFTAFLREFNLRFVRQLCFLDGTKGIIYGIYQIYSRLISYSKLWEKQLSTIRT